MPSTVQSVGSFLMKLFCILLLSLSLLPTQVNSEGILQVQIDKADIDIPHDVNQSLSLNCTVSSDDAGPIESITWKKDAKLLNATISSENWSVVVIKNLSRSDAGYYKCVAKSKRRKGENGVFVNVKGKPIIFKNGEPMFYTRSPKWISKGGWQPVKLVCYATGSKVINFQWLKDGKEIIQPNKLVFIKSAERGYGSILTFVPILKKKELRYTCQARNEYGMDSFTIGISVKEQLVGDPEITAESHEISSYIGQSNQLVCNGKNVRELDAYTVWLFNGKELTEEQIKNSSRFHSDIAFWSATNSMRMTLTINQTSLEDAGNYTCEVIINQDVYNRTILLNVMSKAKGPSGGREQQRLTSLQLIGLIIGILVPIITFLILMLSLKRRKKIKVPEIPQGHFEYGAFITYNSQDFIWVKTNLLPLLESNDINFCIHYRNFEPGVAIQENMVNSVYKSRVVIVVMSNNYMKSKYCRAELDYAVHRALEEHGTNPLVILRIDPAIKKSKLPKEIKNKTFLDVASNVEKATWEKRLLKYVTWSGNDENENEEVKDEEDLHVALLKQGGEEDFEKNGISKEVKKACAV